MEGEELCSPRKKFKQQYPGFCDEAYPNVFNINAMPKQPALLKPGQLKESDIRHYFEKGYLIVPNCFDKADLDAVRKDVEKLVDELAQDLFQAGKIKSLHKEHGLFQRLTYIEKEFPGANIVLHKIGKLTKGMQDLWSNEKLLNLVEQLIGPEIMGHPVWNLRTKTPQNEATTVPWHQDNAYLDNDAYKVLQPGVWIPLLDANKRNGCMEVLSGGHERGIVARHTCCSGNTWYVEMDEEDAKQKLHIDLERDKVLCPVPYGGMLIINNMIPHRSLNNLSDQIRWSLDFRWQTPAKPVGFYGLKEGIMMRSEKEPVEQIDWDSFNNVERHQEAVKICREEGEEEKFETTIVGPWMKKWEMTHTNRHTEKFTSRADVAWHKA